MLPTNRHHNRVHRENRTTANSIATINSVATGDISTMSAATSEAGDIYDSNNTQVCDLRYFRKTLNKDKCNEQNLIFFTKTKHFLNLKKVRILDTFQI